MTPWCPHIITLWQSTNLEPLFWTLVLAPTCRVSTEGIFSSVPVEGSTQSLFLEGPILQWPWGVSWLIYHPVLSLAHDRRHFFFFFTSWLKWRRVSCCAPALAADGPFFCRAACPSTHCVHSCAENPAGFGMRRRNSGGLQVAFEDVSS